MRLSIFIAIFSCFAWLPAQTLTQAEIDSINRTVDQLDDEFVAPNEQVVIETDLGKIVIELFANSTPLHAMNFKKLVNAGYFTGTCFHRVIPGFVIQGGDIFSRDSIPDNDGLGGTNYTIPAEFGHKNVRGAVASAREGDQYNPEKRSSGSQFYICLVDIPRLDPAGYTVFGKVIEGMETVDKIATAKTGKNDRPMQNVVMQKVYMIKTEVPEEQPR
jgi:cyclophilin family peptidyl-prolyl cis-trans isomerase